MLKIFKKVALLSMVIGSMVIGSSSTVLAADKNQPEVISRTVFYTEDGTRVEEVLTKLNSEITPFGAERVTYEKKQTHGSSSKYVKLTATFSYDKVLKRVSCVSKFAEQSGMVDYKQKSLTASAADINCHVNLKYTYESLAGLAHGGIKIICDYNGDVIN